jgi:acyl carrier protein
VGLISRILGKGDEPAQGGERSDGAATAAAPDAATAAAPDAATAATPDAAGDAPLGHARILAGLKAHLAASAEASGKSLDGVALQDDVDLYEAGYLDSLIASEFLIRAEKDFGVELPDWLIGGRANTLASLARYIDGEQSSR